MTDFMAEFCKWEEGEDGVWQTDCEHAFIFNDDGPTENQASFCMYCGQPIEEIKFTWPEVLSDDDM